MGHGDGQRRQQTEVGQLGFAPEEEDVLGLDVAMGEAGLMKGTDGAEDVGEG